jgi:hypothetical protein
MKQQPEFKKGKDLTERTPRRKQKEVTEKWCQ